MPQGKLSGVFTVLAKSSLFRASGIYVTANILNAAIPFLLIPVLTRYLTTEDYGKVAMFTMLISFLGPFVGLSIHSAISRRYFSEEDRSSFSRYVGNCFYLLLISTLIVCFLMGIFVKPIAHYTSVPDKWLFVSILICFAQFINLSLLTIWQVSVQPLYFGAFQILQTILNFGLTVCFVIFAGYQWEGRVLAQLLAVSFFALISMLLLFRNKWISFEYNKEDMRHILRFSLPLIPHTLGGLLIGLTDRLFLNNMAGTDATGVFMVAFQLSNVLSLLMSSFMSAYIPWLYDKLNKNDVSLKLKIVGLTYVFFIVLAVIPFACQLILPWFLGFFVGRSFAGVIDYTFWLLLGYCFNGMYLMISGFIFYAEKTRYLAYITFSISIINIPLCYFLIKYHGPVGAAQATTVAFFLSFIFTWWLSNHVYPMPWFRFFSSKGKAYLGGGAPQTDHHEN